MLTVAPPSSTVTLIRILHKPACIVGVRLKRASIEHDRCRRCAFIGYEFGLESSAVEVQRAGGTVFEARPSAGSDLERAATLYNRRRAAAVANLQVAACRLPVAASFVNDKVAELHRAGTRDVRVRCIEVAFVEIAGLRRVDDDRPEIGNGIVVKVVENEMPRHVKLDGVLVSPQGCIASDGQVPCVQRHRVETHFRSCTAVADADKVLVVIRTRIAGIGESIFTQPLETPIPAIGNVTEAKSGIGCFSDTFRKEDEIFAFPRQITFPEVSSATTSTPVPACRKVAAFVACPVFRRPGGLRRRDHRKREHGRRDNARPSRT